MNENQKTKIVATIGPASDNYDTLKQLVQNGITCIRVNFSHGSGKEHKIKYDTARQVAKDLNINLSLLLDTKGPEIRIGKMQDDIQLIEKNQTLKLICDSTIYSTFIGNNKEVCVSYEMHNDLKEGDVVLLDDGKLKTVVTRIYDNVVEVLTSNSHNLKTNKRINIPGVDFSLPFLSQKDKDDVLFGIEYGVDIIAASFVNSKENIQELRSFLNENGGSHIKICSKIESQTAINNIDSIIEASDSIMIARGDLGLEIPYYMVPNVERMIIKKCNKLNKEVIVATQMLDSMEKNPLPTRAEVSDIYWANVLGADATMLSGETASGSWPVEAVKIMNKVNQQAMEDLFNDSKNYTEYLDSVLEISDEEEQWAYDLAKEIYSSNEEAIIIATDDLKDLKVISKYRPKARIIVISNDEKLKNSLGIMHNVFASNVDSDKYEDFLENEDFWKEFESKHNLEDKEYTVLIK
ncbi:pyruvate kinase [[Mycoplasma] gypis]|uniref:Pyruvate kinase n=1 Tax=[Mycoplasma] gypis TaxID=92404 RepID=A0ABZ2RRI5_9BACT|nr:pyruvate kinase [[Mycoplasma] gypis]MBN0919047.1 pyruvate kinase [[Mycoplasma] gypis]